MAVNLNSVILAGNLTRDPELRYLPSGTPVSKLSIAVNNRVKKGEEWVDDPMFIDVNVFGSNAEYIVERTAKGSPVLVQGRLQYRTWTDQEGAKHSRHEVVAQRVQTLRTQTREPGEDDVATTAAEGDDAIPF
jgi:single-strand DNA-binding protein